jgi:hypothetical protein
VLVLACFCLCVFVRIFFFLFSCCCSRLWRGFRELNSGVMLFMVGSIVEGGVGGLVERFVFCTLQQMAVSNKRGGEVHDKRDGTV